MQTIDKLRDISYKYEVYGVDIYGVIFDGKVILSEALNALKGLIADNKKVFFISNSPSKPAELINFLITKVKDQEDHDFLRSVQCFTSGGCFLSFIEEIINSKKSKNSKFNQINIEGEIFSNNKIEQFELYDYIVNGKIGIIGNENHNLITEIKKMLIENDLELNIAENISDADYLLFLASGKDLYQFDEEVKKISKKNIIALCPNPDLIAPSSDNFHYTSGSYAERYAEKFNMRVIYFGKPMKFFYDLILHELKPNVFSNYKINENSDYSFKNIKTLFIGDSFKHDIIGAHNIFCDSLLVGDINLLNDNITNIEKDKFSKKVNEKKISANYYINSLR